MLRFGPTRRAFLQAGAGLGLGGLCPGRVAAGPPAGGPKPIRACILVFYYGGPSHLETFDPKPDAPAEVRGEYRSIPTAVPGVRVSEHLPRVARLLDR
ncbi:MAG: DUF1501 domain-containing protein, partial [Zavarzinella sp.]|nr:DUF1501 domain-containing protein [Zavarzinella sp.]